MMGSATFDVVKIFNRVASARTASAAFEVHTSNDHPCGRWRAAPTTLTGGGVRARDGGGRRSTSSAGVWYAGEQGDGNRCQWDESAAVDAVLLGHGGR